MFAKIICIVIALFVASGATKGEEQPLYEYGVGVAGLHNPHYLGADQTSNYLLPVPYFVYRGETIQADRRGIRAFLYDSDKLKLRISGGGSLPVDSDDNDARDGMDDLDILAEIGPTLQYSLYETRDQLLRIDFPVRAAFTLGNKFLNHQGWTSNPRLHHEIKLGKWLMTSTAGPVFSDRRYHGYIYDVGQQDVRADREYYQSKSGYTAMRFSTGIRQRWGDYYLGAKLSYYNLNDAANEASPLVKSEDYIAVSLVFAWVFGESKASSNSKNGINE